MKKTIIALIAIIFAGAVFFLARNAFRKNNLPATASDIPTGIPATIENQNFPQNPPTLQNTDSFQPPLDRAAGRVTKKPFGVFITPQTSPVQPERFRGYHTGTDFEIFPEEVNADVPVRAVCDGKLAVKKSATGYGGVAVQNCKIDDQSVAVVYGHLKLTSISKKAGEDLDAGEAIGILGKEYSSETDGERKHLHLGIRKGSAINILGYVSSQSQLSGWLDPCQYICK